MPWPMRTGPEPITSAAGRSTGAASGGGPGAGGGGGKEGGRGGGGGGAAAKRGKEAPQPRVGGRQETAQDERPGGPNRVRAIRADQAVLSHEHFAEPLLGARPLRPLTQPRDRAREVVQGLAPSLVLGQEPGARLFEAA